MFGVGGTGFGGFGGTPAPAARTATTFGGTSFGTQPAQQSQAQLSGLNLAGSGPGTGFQPAASAVGQTQGFQPAPGAAAQATTTQNVPPKPVSVQSRNKSGGTTAVLYYNITANQQLQGLSNEELRMADYRANSKGNVQAPTWITPGGSTPQAGQAGAVGGGFQSAGFGATPTTSSGGFMGVSNPATSQPAFGTGATTVGGGTGGFGFQNAAPATSSAFSLGGTGGAATGFGTTPATSFGATSGGFGTQAGGFGTQQQPAFGTQQQGGFGTQPGGFGATASTGFATSAAGTGGAFNFGGTSSAAPALNFGGATGGAPAFGAPATTTAGTGAGFNFGGAPATGGTAAGGGFNFGGTPGFGATSAAAAPTATTGGGGFNLGGASTGTGFGAFGSAPMQQPQQGTGFSMQPMQPMQTGGGATGLAYAPGVGSVPPAPSVLHDKDLYGLEAKSHIEALLRPGERRNGAPLYGAGGGGRQDRYSRTHSPQRGAGSSSSSSFGALGGAGDLGRASRLAATSMHAGVRAPASRVLQRRLGAFPTREGEFGEGRGSLMLTDAPALGPVVEGGAGPKRLVLRKSARGAMISSGGLPDAPPHLPALEAGPSSVDHASVLSASREVRSRLAGSGEEKEDDERGGRLERVEDEGEESGESKEGDEDEDEDEDEEEEEEEEEVDDVDDEGESEEEEEQGLVGRDGLRGEQNLPQLADPALGERGVSDRLVGQTDEEDAELAEEEAGEEGAPLAEGEFPAHCDLAAWGYRVKPSLARLREQCKEHPSGEPLSRVPNFTVERPGFGSIAWDGEVDVRGLELWRFVRIARPAPHKAAYAEVYPDQDTKPEQGTGLNRPACITLVVHPPRADVDADKWRRRLQRACKKRGSRFLSYDSTTGEWRFHVEHFSRWGLGEDDDDEAEGGTGGRSAAAAVDSSARRRGSAKRASTTRRTRSTAQQRRAGPGSAARTPGQQGFRSSPATGARSGAGTAVRQRRRGATPTTAGTTGSRARIGLDDSDDSDRSDRSSADGADHAASPQRKQAPGTVSRALSLAGGPTPQAAASVDRSRPLGRTADGAVTGGFAARLLAQRRVGGMRPDTTAPSLTGTGRGWGTWGGDSARGGTGRSRDMDEEDEEEEEEKEDGQQYDDNEEEDEDEEEDGYGEDGEEEEEEEDGRYAAGLASNTESSSEEDEDIGGEEEDGAPRRASGEYHSPLLRRRVAERMRWDAPAPRPLPTGATGVAMPAPAPPRRARTLGRPHRAAWHAADRAQGEDGHVVPRDGEGRARRWSIADAFVPSDQRPPLRATAGRFRSDQAAEVSGSAPSPSPLAALLRQADRRRHAARLYDGGHLPRSAQFLHRRPALSWGPRGTLVSATAATGSAVTVFRLTYSVPRPRARVALEPMLQAALRASLWEERVEGELEGASRAAPLDGADSGAASLWDTPVDAWHEPEREGPVPEGGVAEESVARASGARMHSARTPRGPRLLRLLEWLEDAAAQSGDAFSGDVMALVQALWGWERVDPARAADAPEGVRAAVAATLRARRDACMQPARAVSRQTAVLLTPAVASLGQHPLPGEGEDTVLSGEEIEARQALCRNEALHKWLASPEPCARGEEAGDDPPLARALKLLVRGRTQEAAQCCDEARFPRLAWLVAGSSCGGLAARESVGDLLKSWFGADDPAPLRLQQQARAAGVQELPLDDYSEFRGEGDHSDAEQGEGDEEDEDAVGGGAWERDLAFERQRMEREEDEDEDEEEGEGGSDHARAVAHMVPHGARRLLLALAGMLDAVDVALWRMPWRHALSAILRLSVEPREAAMEPLARFRELLAYGYAPAPLSPHAASGAGREPWRSAAARRLRAAAGEEGALHARAALPLQDVRFLLLALCEDGDAVPLSSVARAETHAASPMDAALSWHLLRVLDALGVGRAEDRGVALARAGAAFIEQLETSGMWEWAVFVALFLPQRTAEERARRLSLVRHLVARNPGMASLRSSVEEGTVGARLGLPLHLVASTLGDRAAAEQRWRVAIDMLHASGRFARAHALLVRDVAPVLVRVNARKLHQMLCELTDGSAHIPAWRQRGNVVRVLLERMLGLATGHEPGARDQLVECGKHLRHWSERARGLEGLTGGGLHGGPSARAHAVLGRAFRALLSRCAVELAAAGGGSDPHSRTAAQDEVGLLAATLAELRGAAAPDDLADAVVPAMERLAALPVGLATA